MIEFEVKNLHNGRECSDKSLQTVITVGREEGGLRVTAVAQNFSVKHVPAAPTGTRFDGLWEYDVSEIFFVGEGNKYIEIELGTAGHFLVLGFDGIRKRINDYYDIDFEHDFVIDENGISTSTILIPNNILPPTIKRINAFLIGNQQFLAYSPLPGEKPDFHQPSKFPEMSV